MPKKRTPPQARRSAEPTGRLAISINGHELTGTKLEAWSFACPDWPDLAEKYTRANDFAGMLEAFNRRTLVGA